MVYVFSALRVFSGKENLLILRWIELIGRKNIEKLNGLSNISF